MDWEQVAYAVSQEHQDVRVSAFVQAQRALYPNGNCMLARAIATNPSAFDGAFRNDLRGLPHLLGTFLRNPALATHFQS